MRVFQKTIPVKTEKLYDFVEITAKIQEVVRESKISDGIVFINSMHTTASVIIQEDDSRIHRDLIRFLDRIAPLSAKYEHDDEGSENATAHLKSNLLGSSIIVPLKNGELTLGTWQKIFFVELFKPRNRQIGITIIGE